MNYVLYRTHRDIMGSEFTVEFEIVDNNKNIKSADYYVQAVPPGIL